MRTNILRAVAVTLGLSVCTVAQAQNSYQAPSKWDNFRPISDKGGAHQIADSAASAATESLPAPVAEPVADSSSTPYQQAMQAPWSGSQMACGNTRAPLNPWFGSANLLFLTLEEGSSQPIATGVNGFSPSAVDPDASTGFDIEAGRYLDCNQFGFGIGYFLWNPDEVSAIRTGTAGTIRSNNASLNDILVDADGAGGNAPEAVYTVINGAGAYAGATGIRATRDVQFQGIEANLYSFGLMGAQRVSYPGCNQSILGKYGRGLGLCNGCSGYGGAAGPLRRPATGRARVMTSHGFRWMQIEDSLEYAYNIDGAGGYSADDLYENVDIENNLFGYQFGGRLTYCLNSRMNLNIGGKFGIYGNNVEMRHRVGTQNDLAYITAAGTDDINTESSDTVLATLGELDLGLGYRLNNAWSVRGGYKLIGVTGVATSVDSVPTDYSSLAASGRVDADDSYLLHGGYVGLEFNW